MFRAAHTSDTHGALLPLRTPGVIVFHSGDFLPNETRGDRKIEPIYQENWMLANRQELQEWLRDRIFVFCAGNHDFYDPVPLLKSFGVAAVNVTNREENVCGLRVYGFPYIPEIKGEWNYETDLATMQRRVEEIPHGLDVLMAHCPPAGILCEEDWKLGNTSLANWISYGDPASLPKLLLCGHFHGSHGIRYLPMEGTAGVVVSNAATTVHNLEMPW